MKPDGYEESVRTCGAVVLVAGLSSGEGKSCGSPRARWVGWWLSYL